MRGPSIPVDSKWRRLQTRKKLQEKLREDKRNILPIFYVRAPHLLLLTPLSRSSLHAAYRRKAFSSPFAPRAMFVATRQSHAATATIRLLSASRLSSQSHTTFKLTRLLSYIPSTRPFPTANCLRTFSQWRRYSAAAQAAVEVEAEDLGREGENAQQFHRNPSRLGAVTKFQELKDRNLVCRTVVDTLTKDMGLVDMTEVQSKTINETLKGIDV